MASLDTDNQDYITPEAQAFRVHYGRLLKAIQESELPILGADLFSEFVISSDLLEQMGKQALARADKGTKLLLAVMSHLEINPGKFEGVLKVISQEPTLRSISAEIKTTYDKTKAKNSGKLSPGPPVSTHQQYSVCTNTSAISQYSAYLKSLYKRAKLPMGNKLSPFPCKKIIRLAVVEKCSSLSPELDEETFFYKSKNSVLDQFIQEANVTPIEFRDILKMTDGSQPKCVIVQGVPGIGKSTFAWKACRKWGKGRLFQEYDLVVLIRMRDTYVREAKNLSDLLFYPGPGKKLSCEVEKEMIEKNGKRMLFILEGIDELPASILNDETSIVVELLQGILLPDVTILATTRPWAVHAILEKCEGQISRHIEILGFRKEEILCYISNSFSGEEQEEFLQYLTTQPHIHAIMYVPLHTAIVVQIYLERKRTKKPLPVTMTQLYTALVQSLVVRYIKCLPEYKDIRVEDLKNLPGPILEHFGQICALAYAGFMKPSIQVVFSESDFPSGSDVLGLMQLTSDVLIDVGYSVGYTFSHISIQEFLAAYHLSLQDQDTVKDFVVKNYNSPLYKDMLLFLSGLTRFIEIDYIQNFIFPVYTRKHGYVSNKITRIHSIECLHWIYEGQYAEKCKEILTAVVVYFFPLDKNQLPLILSSPFDINALHYCISHSSCCWNVLLNTMSSTLQALPPYRPCGLSPKGVDQFTQPFATIKSLIVIGRDVDRAPITFSMFLRAIPPHAEIKSILLMDGRIFLPKIDRHFLSTLPAVADSECNLLSDTRLGCLEGFSLCGVFLSDEIALNLLKAIQTKTPTITTIALPLTNVGCTAVFSICKIVSKTKILKHLNLSGSSLSSESLQLLFGALANSVSLTTLLISGNVMTVADVEFLSLSISLNKHLNEILLDWCGINAEGAEHLAVGLSKNTTLKFLNLRGNNLAVTGACALADMLKENKALERVDVSNDSSVQAKGAESLILALEINRTLQQLILSEELTPYLGYLYEADYIMQFSVGKNRINFVKKSSRTVVQNISAASMTLEFKHYLINNLSS